MTTKERATDDVTRLDDAIGHPADEDTTDTAAEPAHGPDAFADTFRGLDPEVQEVFFSLLRIAHTMFENKDHPDMRPFTKSWEKQPVGYPEPVPAAIDSDQLYTVFTVLQDALSAWHMPDGVDREARREWQRLTDTIEAFGIVTKAYQEAEEPFNRAHYEDQRAAAEWCSHRWSERIRLAEEQAAMDSAQEANDGGIQL